MSDEWVFKSIKYSPGGGSVIIDEVPQPSELRVVEMKRGHEQSLFRYGCMANIPNSWCRIEFNDGRIGILTNAELHQQREEAIIAARQYAAEGGESEGKINA